MARSCEGFCFGKCWRDYGWGFVYWTPSHIKKFKEEALVGNRYINRGITGAVVERQPFGGFKMSGAGSKAGGRDYLLNFMYPISNSTNTARSGHIPGIEDFVDKESKRLCLISSHCLKSR